MILKPSWKKIKRYGACCFIAVSIALAGCSEPEFTVDFSSVGAMESTFDRLEASSVPDEKGIAFAQAFPYLINKYSSDFQVTRSAYQGYPRMQENLHGKTIDEIILIAADFQNNPRIYGEVPKYLDHYLDKVRRDLDMSQRASFNDALDVISTVLTAELRAEGLKEHEINAQIAYFLHGRTAEEISRISPKYYAKRGVAE